MSKTKLLIVDIIFPCTIGNWRTSEIHFFLNNPNFVTDILVSPYFEGIERTTSRSLVDIFKEYYDTYPHLKGYNIFIFNKKRNAINQFNKSTLSDGKIFDGTKFNGLIPGDYLFSKSENLTPSSYDVCYCIFMKSFASNIAAIDKYSWPVVCKVYPGGGYFGRCKGNDLNMLSLKVRNASAIVTQPFIYNHALDFLPRENVLPIYGVPTVDTLDHPPYIPKALKPYQIDICFSSFGYNERKGMSSFIKLATYFSEHNDSSISDVKIYFHICGMVGSSALKNLTYHGVKPIKELIIFYSETVDIFVSPNVYDNRKEPDGFPLGTEAMIQGCIPIICDPLNCNIGLSKDMFNENDSLVMTSFDFQKSIAFIIDLCKDPAKRLQMSHRVAEKSRYLFGPEKQLHPVEKFLLSTARKRKEGLRNQNNI